MRYTNELIHETSPYLLQHAHNPVNWYPWGEEAFSKAKREDKPIFLSIGYSTCHWCHVMAHESFEDETVSEILNRHFVSVKVDREERPDIDNVYMRACQALTGGGGWPMSVFMSADGKPFFAGTYFSKQAFLKLLDAIVSDWEYNRDNLLESSEQISNAMKKERVRESDEERAPIREATDMFRRSFDEKYGGFGGAPKFPSPQNLMFLLYTAFDMAKTTLLRMYLGGIFDHIGGGFSRYSTDRYWLVPHFEKMLYDNALISMAYLLAYEQTGEEFYKSVAQMVFLYLEREMKCEDGGFYSAQDADSDGEEGKFYVFTRAELEALLGKSDGARFCDYFGVTERGNFEGRNVLNLLHNPAPDPYIERLILKVYEYRGKRAKLHTDKKRLTSWNALLAASYAYAARILKDDRYMKTAREIVTFIERKLISEDTVFVGMSGEKRLGAGFLDDYAFYIFALIQMYEADFDETYLLRAEELAEKVCGSFWDDEDGGFFFSGEENEKLISRPKESFDGALPSGNSVMAYVLSRLSLLLENGKFDEILKKHTAFMNREAAAYPMGFAFYLYSTLPVKKVVCVPKNDNELKKICVRSDWAFKALNESKEYRMINGETTYYVCENGTCLPPSNKI